MKNFRWWPSIGKKLSSSFSRRVTGATNVLSPGTVYIVLASGPIGAPQLLIR